MVTRFWLCFRFFEFRGRGCELNFETNAEFEILHMYGHDHCDRWLSMCTQLSRCSSFFFIFFFFSAIRKFRIISFSKHCARRKKTEESRQTVAKRAATNRFSFFGFFLGSKEWEVIVTIISLCSVLIVVMLIGYLHADPSSWSSYRGKFVILLISVAVVVYKSFALN